MERLQDSTLLLLELCPKVRWKQWALPPLNYTRRCHIKSTCSTCECYWCLCSSLTCTTSPCFGNQGLWGSLFPSPEQKQGVTSLFLWKQLHSIIYIKQKNIFLQDYNTMHSQPQAVHYKWLSGDNPNTSFIYLSKESEGTLLWTPFLN